MSYSEDRSGEQRGRAEQIARELSGKAAPSRNLVNSMLALVVADERTDIPRQEGPGPAAGARQILHRPKPVQEALW